LDITQGDINRFVLIRTPESELQNRLLMVVHHLAIDGVSWRIIIEDLEQILEALIQNKEPKLETKSSSYRQWYQALESYSQTAQVQSSLGYWQKTVESYESLLGDKPIKRPSLEKDIRVYQSQLNIPHTEQLVRQSSKAYHTEINDLLLAALAQTLADYSQTTRVSIGMEGHGREPIDPQTDTSRTVGWFTSLYPVSLKLDEEHDPSALIKSTKEQLRKIPDKGLSYGVLKYLTKSPGLQGKDPWDIVFNYLGQLDTATGKQSLIQVAKESTGKGKSGEQELKEKLSVDCRIQNKQLEINWSYDSQAFSSQKIEQLSAAYLSNLESLIVHCISQSRPTSTPSDYGLLEIDYRDLDVFLKEEYNGKPRREQVESMYRLSGLQQGMLFHNLYDKTSGAYIEQLSADLTDVQQQSFLGAWQEVLKNHSILRSGFYHKQLAIAVQCVYKQVTLPFEVLDLSGLDQEEQEKAILDYKKTDRVKGFDLEQAPLMRVTLLKLDKKRMHMLWTSHHLLFDGWSLPILMEEFLRTYETLLNKEQPEEKTQDRYEDYIRYIESQNKSKQKDYWQAYLSKTDQGTLLPFVSTGVNRTKGLGDYRTRNTELTIATTEAINQFARQHHITVNTLMQGVWSYLLHGYTGLENITYGVVVSGRPDELPNIEQRVGMFINTLPFCTGIDGQQAIETWLQSIQTQQIESRQYQFTPLNEIQGYAKVEGDLFDSLLIFENYPISKVLSSKHWALGIKNVQMQEQTNYPLTLLIITNPTIQIKWSYNAELIQSESIETIQGHFEYVLAQIISKTPTKVQDLDLLTSEERHQLLVEFNQTSAVYPKDQTIVELFEQQVKSTPNQTALVYEGQTLSYQELNERANQLAYYLRAKGVKPETRVAICLDRGFEMLVGILGILKSGGAYVPIDPQYPAERVQYMLEDCSATIVVSTSAQSALFQEHQAIKQTELDQLDLSKYPKTNPDKTVTQDNLAYVIYTSGSTGKPKGVMIEHGNVYSFIDWCKTEFNAQSFEMVYAGTSMCFDLSVYEFFYPLSIGKTIRVLENGLEIGKYIKTDQQVLTNSVPSVIESLLKQQIDFSNAKVINMAGEPISDYVQQTLDTQTIEVRNLYGPSEDTTYSTVYRLSPQTSLKIGKPIANTKVFILSPTQDLLPIGVKGEIYLGGAGLARGYLNNEALTQEKFIPNPFDKTERLYRTGDIGRWLKDGNIEYLGRVDDQIKIRGYRIELGEIETAIAQIKTISQSVVVAQTEPSGAKRLVAYVVAKNQFDKSQVIEKLKQSLPEYMIPQLWIALDSLPLTANGKIDKKALPKPDMDAELKQHYQAAESKTEQDLVKIWEELLGISPIGTRANFFELGGDSILTIQVVSRASRLGYSLQPKDIFTHQTISALALALAQKNQSEIKAEQGKLQGELGLIPIQSWYLETAKEHVSHFNQSVILALNKQIDSSMLEECFRVISNFHDSLRLVFRKEDGSWIQQYGHGGISLQTEDLQLLSADEIPGKIFELSALVQQSLSIENGILAKAIWIKMPEKVSRNRLLIVIHHLAVDGVSWRIILEDLQVLITKARLGESLDLGNKTSSYRQWSQALQIYGQKEETLKHLSFWQKAVESYHPLKTDYDSSKIARVENVNQLEVQLSKKLTRHLIQDVHKAYHTEINDILLAALAKTVANYTTEKLVSFGLEGHGRQNIDNNINTSKTVGWFTSLYPVVVDLQNEDNLSQIIKSTKEQLRQIPDKGLSYGVLKYINRFESLKGHEPWDIVFNYLGQLDTATGDNSWIEIASEITASNSGIQQILKENISVNCKIQQSVLNINWTYNSLLFKEETIEILANEFSKNLEDLILHCMEQAVSNYTPSDFGLGNSVSYQEFDRFYTETCFDESRKNKIESFGRLTGLQQGILFHSLYDHESGAYQEQITADFYDLNTDYFEKAWQLVLNRHTALRSAFFYDAFKIPVQVVFTQVKLPLEFLDFSHLKDEEQLITLKKYKSSDLLKGFDLQNPPLMRVALIRLNQERTHMLWTSHHLLFDGWSLSVMMEEFLTYYQQLAAGSLPEIKEIDDFGKYIQYLEIQDKWKAKSYWKNYLKDIEQETHLPFVDATLERNKGAGDYETISLKFNSNFTKALRSYSQKNHLTVNTIIQGTWSYLLHEYTRSKQVAFGVIVSGRPNDLSAMENGVGLYINTLVLCSQKEQNGTVLDWLRNLQNDQINSRQFQYTPLHEIQSFTGVQGDLFDSILTFENYPVSKLIAGKDWGIRVENLQGYGQSNYPLTIIVKDAENIHIDFIYNSSLLNQQTVKRIASHFETVLSQFTLKKDLALNKIQLLTNEEQQLIKDFNPKTFDFPSEVNLVSLFQQQAELKSDAIALVFEEIRLTFQELNAWSNRIAHTLLAQGVKAESKVPILLNRGADMIASILGILKAGAAYVPIDSDIPLERVSYILDDIEAKVLITEESLVSKLKKANVVAIFASQQDMELHQTLSYNPKVQILPEHLAYVIYTSGSTGEPKGVMVEHRNLVDYYFGLKQHTKLELCHSFALVSSIATDLGNTSIFGALLSGAALHVFTKGFVSNIEGLLGYFNQNSIDCLKIVPSHWRALSLKNQLLLPQKLLIFGGETLKTEYAFEIAESGTLCEIYNHYGPTETTIGKLIHKFEKTRSYGKSIPIGRPFSDTDVYVLNESRQKVPIGVPGELHIGGAGVARGYLNNDTLTAEKFIFLQTRASETQRVYATGDLVKYEEDGNIVFLGRLDEQVKIRGYRIELAEIERVLLKAKDVLQAVVIAREDKQGNNRLLAYLTADSLYNQQETQSFLTDKLPEYMVPAFLCKLESLPLTANGKIDKRALPEPEVYQIVNQEHGLVLDETEQKLSEIWAEILELESVGINDDFFELGGHSLLAIRLVSAIRRTFKVEMPIGDIFDFPTIVQLKDRLDLNSEKDVLLRIELIERPELIPLSFSQERLWFIDQLEGSVQYHLPSVLRLKGNLNIEALKTALHKMVDRHEVLRTVIFESNGQGFQKVRQADVWQLEIRNELWSKGNLELDDSIQQFISHPFDLLADYMIRARLYSLNSEEHVLVLVIHHLATDAWSNSVLVSDVMEFYNAYLENRTPVLTDLKLQYADYALWLRNHLSESVLEAKINYWKNKLSEVKPLELPTDFPRQSILGNQGAKFEFMFESELLQQVQKLSQQFGATVYITLQAIFKVLLFRHTNQTDICIGTSVARRDREELLNMLGFFVNTIALRDELNKDITFAKLLEQVRQTTLEAYENQDVPFEKVVESVVKGRELGRSPIFQVMLVMNNTPENQSLEFADLEVSAEDFYQNKVKFEMTFFMKVTPGGLQGSVHYSSELYSEDSVKRMVGHFAELINSASANPLQKIGLMQMLTEKEQQQLLEDFLDFD
jgi:amino acid adenylation domain-containing protein/non-ribosomal peptide synthase protein (TIGR01720 family)